MIQLKSIAFVNYDCIDNIERILNHKSLMNQK